MKLILRILFIAAFLGSLYWIHVYPSEPEPYISTVLAVAALLGTFYESQKKEANIVPRLVRRPTVRNGKAWDLHYLVVQNNGENEVKDLEIRIPLRERQSNPLLEDEKEDGVLRIPSLHPDQNFESPMALSFDTGTEFDVIWSWRTSRGRKEERKGFLRLEG